MNKNFLFLILIIFTSCSKPNKKGGIIFSFDDQFVEEWLEYQNIFKKYNIKSTFFITRPHLLNQNKILGLKKLQKLGHEIACHSLNHTNSMTYKDSANRYFFNEIKSANKILKKHDFKVCSFAYPYGKSTKNIDSLLSKEIKFIRKATWNYKDTTIDNYDEIFAKKTSFNIVNAMGIDYNYKISIENLRTGIKRAKKNNEVLILYAHRINTTKESYTILPTYLEAAFKLCKEEEINILRMKDLENFFRD